MIVNNENKAVRMLRVVNWLNLKFLAYLDLITS